MKVRTKEFNANMRKLTASLTTAAPIMLRTAGADVWRKSQQMVPVDTGLLKSTGAVSVARNIKGVFSVDVSYGGPITGFSKKYVYYARPQNKRHGYLTRAAEQSLVMNRISSMFRTWVSNPHNPLPQPPEPPYRSQNNPDSAVLAPFKDQVRTTR